MKRALAVIAALAGGVTLLAQMKETVNVSVIEVPVTVVDSSGNGRDATVETPLVGDRPGKSFKHRHVPTSTLIPWKDQQVFMPFVEGIASAASSASLGMPALSRRLSISLRAMLASPGTTGST